MNHLIFLLKKNYNFFVFCMNLCYRLCSVLFVLTGHVNYQQLALAPLSSETHGGDDVAIFAKGPWAHLFTGVNEQNVIPHVMAFASCVGRGVTTCENIA